MKNTSITEITPGQRKQFLRFVEDAAERALEKSCLDKNGIQKLIENGGEVQNDIIALIKQHSAQDQPVIIEKIGYEAKKQKLKCTMDNIAKKIGPIFNYQLLVKHHRIRSYITSFTHFDIVAVQKSRRPGLFSRDNYRTILTVYEGLLFGLKVSCTVYDSRIFDIVNHEINDYTREIKAPEVEIVRGN